MTPQLTKRKIHHRATEGTEMKPDTKQKRVNESAPAFGVRGACSRFRPPTACESAGKPDALQTLREVFHISVPSVPLWFNEVFRSHPCQSATSVVNPFRFSSSVPSVPLWFNLLVSPIRVIRAIRGSDAF